MPVHITYQLNAQMVCVQAVQTNAQPMLNVQKAKLFVMMVLAKKIHLLVQVNKAAQLTNHLDALMVTVLIFTMVKLAQSASVLKKNLTNVLMVSV